MIGDFLEKNRTWVVIAICVIASLIVVLFAFGRIFEATSVSGLLAALGLTAKHQAQKEALKKERDQQLQRHQTEYDKAIDRITEHAKKKIAEDKDDFKRLPNGQVKAKLLKDLDKDPWT